MMLLAHKDITKTLNSENVLLVTTHVTLVPLPVTVTVPLVLKPMPYTTELV